MANKRLRQYFWSFNRHMFAKIMKDKYNLCYDEQCDPLPDSSFIMVSNHGTFFDPWIIAHPSPRPVSIMMNEEGFKAKPVTRWYLDKIGAFPKKKGGTDIKSMKTALKRLAQGSPLLIFPEGQTTWDGETQPIFAGIEKLILKSNLPLVMVNLSGNFLSRPWWSSVDRKGTIRVKRTVIYPAELKELGAEAIKSNIISYISNNDCKNQQIQSVNFSCETPTDGLNRLLWICPSCGNDHSLQFSPKQIHCSACGKSESITPNLTLPTAHYEQVRDLHDWMHFQKNEVKAAIASAVTGVTITSDESIRLVEVDYAGTVVTLDTGKLLLTKEMLTFAGEHGTLQFPIEKMSIPVFQKKDVVQFSIEGQERDINFYFESIPVFKWLMYLRYLTGYEIAETQKFY